MNSKIKKTIIYAGIAVLFAVLAYGFVPQVFSGKVLNQSDTSSWKGMTHEVAEHNAAHPDDKTYWTNSMFGGMPTAAMYDDFAGDWTKPLYKLLMAGKRPANWLFISLVGAFLLMLAFGIDSVLAVAGAIAITFCSYNFQIIQVGHNTKMQAIAFMPWVLAGVVFTYRSAMSAAKDGSWKAWLPKSVLGAVLFALALSMQIKANHPQITYYLAIIIFLYAITLLISAIRKKEGVRRFFITSALLLVVGCIGIATNLNKLIPTMEYSKYTMRGGSELTSDSDSHNSKGLDLDYATAWSYGIEEMPNLMIPNFNGGSSSGELGKDSETYRLLRRAGQQNLEQVRKSLPLYWGPQPFTAGPMYLGAISVFLFIFGLCAYRGKERWWLLAASLIAIMLAWGSHFMWFTKLWFKFVPLYNKFRTVSMALTVLQVSFPLLGILVLDRILKGEYDSSLMKRGWIAYGITAGLCLVFAVFPGIAGTFSGSADAGQADILVEALAADRRSLLVHDAWRSFMLISVVWAIIIWYIYRRKKVSSGSPRNAWIAGGAICCIVLFDLFAIGKRYLNGDNFVTPREIDGQFAERLVDEYIHEDADLSYRVLDVSVNTFNDAIQSYHHKCIGGYSPVKMQRYQDLIDRYLTGEIRSVFKVVDDGAQTIAEVEDRLPFLPVTSMLNGRYIILGENYSPVVNKYAFGNAWFVDKFAVAGTPDEEIAMLKDVDLLHTAVVGNDFVDAVASTPMLSGERGIDLDSIEMTYYAPNELRYNFYTEYGRAVVFSEIFYPKGWKAWIVPNDTDTAEEQEIELFRTDWILRGAILPQGSGELIMRFEPRSYIVGARLSRASSILLLLLLLVSAGGMMWRGFRKNS